MCGNLSQNNKEKVRCTLCSQMKIHKTHIPKLDKFGLLRMGVCNSCCKDCSHNQKKSNMYFFFNFVNILPVDHF